MKQAGILLLSCAATIILHAQASDRQQAWFPDGTGLEVYTEATGSTKPSAAGVSGIGPGIGKQDLVFRLVVDNANHILFGYNLEASQGTGSGAVVIRIEPLSEAMEATLRAEPTNSRWPKFSGAHIPTVATVREFSAVKIGEVVTLDILYNRSTGEKIYDVLRPVAGPSPGGMQVSPSRSREEISLKEVAVKINGKVVHAPTSWLIGAAIRIDIPSSGAYVVAVYDPRNVPPIYEFQPVGHADGKTLRWNIDGDTVEIDSNTNVLTQAMNGVLWVYHDSRYRSQDQPNTVTMQTANAVEWLIPKGNRK